jgi:hypothetical protein
MVIEKLEAFYSLLVRGARSLPQPKTMRDIARELRFPSENCELWRNGQSLPKEVMMRRLSVACGVSYHKLYSARKVSAAAYEEVKAARKGMKFIPKTNPDCEVFIGQGRAHCRGRRATGNNGWS